jgi:hypothetical protein
LEVVHARLAVSSASAFSRAAAPLFVSGPVEPVSVEPVSVEPVSVEPVSVEPDSVEPIQSKSLTADTGTPSAASPAQGVVVAPLWGSTDPRLTAHELAAAGAAAYLDPVLERQLTRNLAARLRKVKRRPCPL